MQNSAATPPAPPPMPSTADLVYRLGSPFVRLAALLEGVTPARDVVLMAVGEPKHAQPPFVADVLNAHLAGFSNYPINNGTPVLRAAVARWANKRYRLNQPLDPDKHVLALNGSREGLAFGAMTANELCAARLGGKTPAVLLPNPFYQGYVGGALAAGADSVFLDDAFIDPARIDPDLAERLIAIYVASPANPQGTMLTIEDWERLIAYCRAHDIWLFADECYSELYGETPPPGVLEAAARTGSYDHVVSFNSLSKRSNLPGLRVGFMMGDPLFMQTALKLRAMAAPQVPAPLQMVAAAALDDETHVELNRALYAQKWAIADALLGDVKTYKRADAGFFLWLDIGGDDAAFVRTLYAEEGLRIVPGSYLAGTTSGTGPGCGFIRVALVESPELTREGLGRLRAGLARHRPGLLRTPSRHAG